MVRIANPVDPKRHHDLEFLVDSGATYTIVPEEILCGLGINRRSKRLFILANGEKMERSMGNAEVCYRRRRGAATVIFGEKGDLPVLGATALEALGFILDPFHRTLKALALTL
jgi:clan AA aspartic protease